MRQADLQRVQPGFSDPIAGAQAVFRQALHALATPGRPVSLPPLASVPQLGHAPSALLLLALLDADCTLWLSSSVADTDVQAWLRFHTGCRIVDDPSIARFLWLAAGDQFPKLQVMNGGTDEYPDLSATCIIEVEEVSDQEPVWTLQGPGIQDAIELVITGLSHDFEAQWADNHAAFPRGIDVFLTTPTKLLGLPRTTRLLAIETSEG
jgi:alpha-D-ribose 1-methylphosphonate 5-triphosphate synthase subunit PhnH